MCRVSRLLSSCLHVQPNLETSQNVRNSIKKLIELSGGQGEIDLIIGVVILTYLQKKYKIFYMKGTKFSFSIHWIGLHSQLESGVFLLKNKLLRNNKYPIFLSLKITFTLNDEMSFFQRFVRTEMHHTPSPELFVYFVLSSYLPLRSYHWRLHFPDECKFIKNIRLISGFIYLYISQSYIITNIYLLIYLFHDRIAM